MPKFIVERDVPNAGRLTPEQLHSIAVKTCNVLQAMGPTIQWVESFVTDEKIYCIYYARSAAEIREHAEIGGFPANAVNAVRARIDPTTADMRVPAGVR